jgi:hypothetical protein
VPDALNDQTARCSQQQVGLVRAALGESDEVIDEDAIRELLALRRSGLQQNRPWQIQSSAKRAAKSARLTGSMCTPHAVQWGQAVIIDGLTQATDYVDRSIMGDAPSKDAPAMSRDRR